MAFDHEKLDVYQVAIDFLAHADTVAESLPRGRGYIGEQLRRASLSIVLNVAEGAGKFSAGDKATFYLRARGSTTECAAVLDVCKRLSLIGEPSWQEGKAVLERVSQMLTRLVKSRQQDGLGRGRGSGRGRGPSS